MVWKVDGCVEQLAKIDYDENNTTDCFRDMLRRSVEVVPRKQGLKLKEHFVSE